MRITSYLLFLIAIIPPSLQSLSIVSPNELKENVYSPLFRRSGKQFFNITGEMIVAEPYDGCNPTNGDGYLSSSRFSFQ